MSVLSVLSVLSCRSSVTPCQLWRRPSGLPVFTVESRSAAGLTSGPAVFRDCFGPPSRPDCSGAAGWGSSSTRNGDGSPRFSQSFQRRFLGVLFSWDPPFLSILTTETLFTRQCHSRSLKPSGAGTNCVFWQSDRSDQLLCFFFFHSIYENEICISFIQK